MNTNNSIILWLKRNYILLILLGVFIFFIWHQVSVNNTFEDLLNKNYLKQSESFSKQLIEIETVNKSWRDKQDLLNKNYDEQIKLIKEQYKVDLEKITKQQKLNQVQLVKDTEKDPTVLTTKVTEVFGIPTHGSK